MRELLIRYLLGELDANERREVQSQLQANPELRRELAQLRSCFASNLEEELFEPAPPSGLAARTAGQVMGCDGPNEIVAPNYEASFATSSDPPAGILGWNLADLAVAFGVMLAVSTLLFPALRNSRYLTRITECANNERKLGRAFARYADSHAGMYPKVEVNENAGIFVARLIESDCVSPEDMALSLVCPASHTAGEIRSRRMSFRLPSAAVFRGLSPSQMAQLTAKLSPCYGYRLPYEEGGHFHFIRNEHQSLSPVLSDAAGDNSKGQIGSNHGGAIVQVLFEDGSVRILTTRKLPGFDDDMFVNDRGEVAAGLSSHDSVLGRSDAMPGREVGVRSFREK